jgi:hypothetical protein
MTISNVSWYICCTFVLAVMVESAVESAPGHGASPHILMVATAALAILFAAVAILFRLRRLPQPKWLVRVFHGIAVAATLVVVLMIGG